MMKTGNLEINMGPDGISVNGKVLAEVLDSPQARLAGRDDLIKGVFSMVCESHSISEVVSWLGQQNLGPIEQIIALQAVTGWPLQQVKPLFSHYEQGLDDM